MSSALLHWGGGAFLVWGLLMNSRGAECSSPSIYKDSSGRRDGASGCRSDLLRNCRSLS